MHYGRCPHAGPLGGLCISKGLGKRWLCVGPLVERLVLHSWPPQVINCARGWGYETIVGMGPRRVHGVKYNKHTLDDVLQHTHDASSMSASLVCCLVKCMHMRSAGAHVTFPC